jgi:hypothetical protein
LNVVDLLPLNDPSRDYVMADIVGQLARAGHFEKAIPLAAKLTDD